MKPKNPKFSLIGIADDQAVLSLGGRIGAMNGPKSFLKVWDKLNGKVTLKNFVFPMLEVDGLTADIKNNHILASLCVKNAHLVSTRTIIIGGSHDHGYSHLLGVYDFLKTKLKRKPKIGCINIDAHFDVRKPDPQITSGSPFYLAIENKILDPKYFIEFGIQTHANAPALWEYVQKKKIHTVLYQNLRKNKALPVFKNSLKRLERKVDALVLSLDLDALSAAHCPGVSAPQAEGFCSSEIIEMVEAFAKSKKALSFGIFELNPLHDIDQKTARVATTAAYHFVESSLKI